MAAIETRFQKKKIAVIGAGRFGRAFIQGVLKSQLFDAKNIWAAERQAESLQISKAFGIQLRPDLPEVVSDAEIILISVKPAQVKEVIESINPLLTRPETLLISVAAGTSIQKIESLLTKKLAVIRAMPNSPCAIQEGFTALCRGTHAESRHLEDAGVIFNTLGKSLEIDEKLFDLVTALSGSGPAYFYEFMNVMIEAGIKGELTKDQCVALVSQTARGAASMVQSLARSPADLKRDVATPGGCTMAALEVLESSKTAEIFTKAIERATVVASQLGKN